MKKQLLAIALLVAGFTNAQQWTETFSTAAVPNLPTAPLNWLQNNVDGFAVDPSLSSWNFGSNAWVTRDVTTDFNFPTGYGNCAASTSWYSSPNTSDDWLISPTFTVPANGVLNWEAMCTDGSYPDGYEVRISTNGTNVAAFTASPALFSIAAENATFTQRGVSLAAFTGSVVRIAFRNNTNDGVLLLLDNVSCTVPGNATEGSVVSINNLKRYMVGAGNQTISAKFQELGYASATTAVMNYKVNNGSVVTETITFSPAVPYYASSSFSFATPASLVLGKNTIKVWVTKVNGISEVINTNDTAYQTVYVASQSKSRNALVEEWSSSTCNPCASLNSSFDPLLNGNNPNTGGQINVIKYQVNWPSPGNDPSFNNDADTRVTYYGINAAPTAITNGVNRMTNHDQAELNAATVEPAYADITASLTLNGNNIVANATVTPYISIAAPSILKVHQVLAQSNYTFANPSTSQTSFYHVMRKMYPNANGTSIVPVDGTAQTFSFTHSPLFQTIVTSPMTPSGSATFWNATDVKYEYIVFVQDIISNDILQSASAQISFPTGLVQLKGDSQIGVYPNPAKDFAVVGIRLNNNSKVDLNIYDVTGKLVYSAAATDLPQGSNEIKINTSELATGTYNIVVNAGGIILKDKLIVVN